MTRFFAGVALATAMSAASLEVHAHRGAMAVRPENTLPAFEEAIRLGADFIELDVYATRDGVLVVTHDPVINRRICQGPPDERAIHAMTLEEVRRFDCGALRNPAFPRQVAVPGTRIPTLDEVLALRSSSPEVKFNVEIKSNPAKPEHNLAPDAIASAVVDSIRRHRLERRVMVQSFDWRVVQAVVGIAPDLTVAALYGGGERSFADIARETGVKLVTPHFRLVTAEKVKAAHDSGVRVIPWTVDQPAEWDRLIAAGVDGIITNDPGALIAHLTAKGLRRPSTAAAAAGAQP